MGSIIDAFEDELLEYEKGLAKGAMVSASISLRRNEGWDMSWFIFALMAMLFWGAAPIFGKLGLVNVDPLSALTIRTMGVASILIMINIAGSRFGSFAAIQPRAWFFLLAEGICASLLGHYAYFYAMKYTQASRVVPVTAAYPIVAVLLGWMVLKEGLTPLKVLGSILIIAGILLIKR